MDFKQIQELIKMINKSNIGEITIEEKGFRLTLKQKEEPVHQMIAPPVQTSHVPSGPASSQTPVQPTYSASNSEKPKAETSATDNLITIKSPMIGTFYRSSSPDKSPFINVGDEIEVGKVVCIIEAMKLFNEIESEVRGRIVKVLAEDASPVEYDQPLFLVEPS
jgi:acetyl-CoA carboxylase biotin carboxyl carrier protein